MEVNEKNCIPTVLRPALEVQQDLAEASALNSEIVWDMLGSDQSEILTRKLDAMFPNCKKDYASKEDLRKINKHNKSIEQLKSNLFYNIWQQRKYTNGILMHAVIYVIVTPELNKEDAKYSRNYTMHPLFRIRRCLNNNSSERCCMIFIDAKSRVYQNWDDFLNYNELPCGVMIAPRNGCYSLDKEHRVDLEYNFTPAYSYKALSTTDSVVSVVSIVSQAATLLHPLFVISTIGAKTYKTVRNYQKMSDKVAKGTSTSRDATISLSSDILSLTSSVATFGAYTTVPTGGELSFAAELSIQTINSTASLVNGAKLIISTYDLFTKYFVDEQELDFNDFSAFGSSLILFTNSINNIMITSQIGKVGANTLRTLLQSNIRAGFTFASQQVTTHGDLFRFVNDIPYKDVLYNLHKSYKSLTQSGFLACLSVLGSTAAEIIPGLVVQIVNKEITELDLKELSKHYGLKFVKHIASYPNLIDVLNGMGQYFSTIVVQFLLNQTRAFIESTIDQQSVFITTEMILYKMFTNIINNYKNYSYKFLHEKKEDILLGVKNIFESLYPNAEDANAEKYNCCVCGGYYYLAF